MGSPSSKLKRVLMPGGKGEKEKKKKLKLVSETVSYLTRNGKNVFLQIQEGFFFSFSLKTKSLS